MTGRDRDEDGLGPAATFFGAPRWDGTRPGIVLGGAPYDRSSPDHPGGPKEAPAALRRASAQLPFLPLPRTPAEEGASFAGWYHCGLGRHVLDGVALWDGGDLPLPSGLTGEEADRRVEERVRQVLDAGGFPCLIGGEHALTRGALRGAAAALGEPPALLFLDAHTDHGLSHWGGRYPRDSFVDGILADGSSCTVIQLGLRDITHPANAGPVAGVVAIPPRQARRLGPRGLAAWIPAGVRLYLSVDIDVLCPEAAPATRTPVPGGFALDELLELLAPICASPRLAALDLTELDPSRDRDGVTVATALHLLLTVLGWRFAS